MQIFPRTINYLPLVAAIGAGVAGVVLTLGVWYYFSPSNLVVGYVPDQPVRYSHRLHAGQLGIDCRYCHANVERSQEAMIPPTQSCMGCHALVRADSPLLDEVRRSWRTGGSVAWLRVNKLPEHAYFDHSVHLSAGVGCVSCHGRIDQMDVVQIEQPLSMAWCLQCHRNPAPYLMPRDQITNMGWQPGEGDAALIADVRTLNPPEHCSGCHR